MSGTATTTAATATHRKRSAYFVAGAAGLLLAAAYLVLAADYPFGTLDQPGARVWPTVVGGMVIVASLSVLWEAWRMSREETFELPAGPGARRVVLMVVLLLAYFAGMGVLGELPASALFCVLFMRLVSPLSWPRLIAASIVIALALHLVFVVLLKIPMPAGLLHA